MKIMQVIGGGEKGGSRSHILELCQGLGSAGHRAEIVCFLEDAVAASARERAIPVTVFPMGNILDLTVVRRMREHILRERPDIMHTHGVRGNFVGRLASRGTGVPVVTTVHSSVYQDYSHPLKKMLYHRIEKMTRGYTGSFIAVSRSLARELEEDGIDPGKINVVYNGISPGFTDSGQGRPLREELGIHPHLPILISIGRLEEVKNQDMLLRVFARLKEKGSPFHGVLVGDGPLRLSLEQAAKRLGIEDCVSFLGFRKDIFRLLSQSDIFLLTSRMEGLPVTLLEAMAAGTPVVVTEVGGMPEVIEMACNGFTAPGEDVEQFADRVSDLLGDMELRERMADNGKKALREHFSHEKFITGTLEVYAGVLQGVNL